MDKQELYVATSRSRAETFIYATPEIRADRVEIAPAEFKDQGELAHLAEAAERDRAQRAAHDVARLEVTALRIAPPAYVVAELGERSASPAKARAWDAVLPRSSATGALPASPIRSGHLDPRRRAERSERASARRKSALNELGECLRTWVESRCAMPVSRLATKRAPLVTAAVQDLSLLGDPIATMRRPMKLLLILGAGASRNLGERDGSMPLMSDWSTALSEALDRHEGRLGGGLSSQLGDARSRI